MSIELPPLAWPVHEVQVIGSVDGALGKSSLAPFILLFVIISECGIPASLADSFPNVDQ